MPFHSIRSLTVFFAFFTSFLGFFFYPEPSKLLESSFPFPSSFISLSFSLFFICVSYQFSSRSSSHPPHNINRFTPIPSSPPIVISSKSCSGFIYHLPHLVHHFTISPSHNLLPCSVEVGNSSAKHHAWSFVLRPGLINCRLRAGELGPLSPPTDEERDRSHSRTMLMIHHSSCQLPSCPPSLRWPGASTPPMTTSLGSSHPVAFSPRSPIPSSTTRHDASSSESLSGLHPFRILFFPTSSQSTSVVPAAMRERPLTRP
jgi:hypothetical protein